MPEPPPCDEIRSCQRVLSVAAAAGDAGVVAGIAAPKTAVLKMNSQTSDDGRRDDNSWNSTAGGKTEMENTTVTAVVQNENDRLISNWKLDL